jgi:chromosomal replication initiation ATPase DnaA
VTDEVRPEDLRSEVAVAPPPLARHRVPFECILDVVAKEAGCSPAAILGTSRDRRTSAARFAVVHAAREIGGYALTELARLLGRDPATLYNGVARRAASPTRDWRELMERVRLSLSLERK